MFGSSRRFALAILLILLIVVFVGCLSFDFFKKPTVQTEGGWIPVSSVRDSNYKFTLLNGKTYVIFSSPPAKESAFPNANLASFLVGVDSTGTTAGYAKDKKHIYYYSVYTPSGSNDNDIEILTIPSADPGTFEPLFYDYQASPLTSCYAKDKNHVYYYCGSLSAVTITSADPATFTLINESYANARDKNNSYLNGQIVAQQ